MFDPATGQVVKKIADASPADGKAAMDAAVEAFPAWAATPARERAELLRRAFDLLQERKEDFALLMTIEMGKPLAEARGEVAYGGEFLRWFSEETARIQGRYGANPEGTGRMIVSQHPVGPCFLITPWNFPLAMATRKIAPALAAGCTVVIKPAELTPLTTLYFAKLLEDAGLPKGVVNVFTTSTSGAVSEPIIRDPRLRKLSFTGSTAVGQQLLEQAVAGRAAHVDGARRQRAVRRVRRRRPRQGGRRRDPREVPQHRPGVHRGEPLHRAPRRRRRVRPPGDRARAGLQDGPRHRGRRHHRPAHRRPRGREGRGARRRRRRPRRAAAHRRSARSTGEGTFYEATVLTDVKAGSDILREEIFGPVLAIVPFDTEDEAVAIANDTEYGLVSYVFTEILSRGQRMIDKLETGMMGLNVGVVSNAAAPFGGWKMSGLGREGGAEGIHEYLQTKYTLTANPYA